MLRLMCTYLQLNNYYLACWIVGKHVNCEQFHKSIFYLLILLLLIIIYLFFSSLLVMCFIHEPLARILRATSIPHNDFNKFID